MDSQVTVYGVLRLKSWSPFPHAVDMQHIEVHPPADTLPTLGQLYGMAPGLTGDVPARASSSV